jgi:ADP-heptose:LPS heptosyltransferase
MLTAFTRAPVRIGFYTFSLWRRYIYTRHTYFNTAKHVRRIYGLAAEMAGVAQSHESPAPIGLPPEHTTAAADILRRHGWDGAPFVGVNVNASDLALGRRWPVERFAEIVERVAERGHWVFLTGAPAEQTYTQSCLERVNPAARAKVRNLAGAFDILQFLAFLKLARLFVSNDSGPMIFAILVDAPSVTLWGPGDPAMYGGEPPRHRYVYSRYPCSPCMYIPNTDAGYFCRHHFPCMPAIRTDQVAGEVFAALQES